MTFAHACWYPRGLAGKADTVEANFPTDLIRMPTRPLDAISISQSGLLAVPGNTVTVFPFA